jgi:uncharacterized protein
MPAQSEHTTVIVSRSRRRDDIALVVYRPGAARANGRRELGTGSVIVADSSTIGRTASATCEHWERTACSAETELKANRSIWAALLYAGLLGALWAMVSQRGLARNLAGAAPFAFASFGLLLAPIWFFGFGAAGWLRARIRARWLRVALPGLLVLPYLALAVPTGNFRWPWTAILAALPVGLASLLALQTGGLGNLRSDLVESPERVLGWRDICALVVVAALHLLRLLEPAWPYPGLAALSKLYLADVVLYLYLVLRGLGGIGYSFVPSLAALKDGFREWLYFLPFGIGLGTALGFTHFHPRLPSIGDVAAAVLVTLLLVAVPEELFFRGVLQNLLESRLGRLGALVSASLLFGLSHYHRGGRLDWKYILLAAIAGIFYGRAWRRHHHLLAAVTTHTAVDVVWSLWFR